jgi:hypothetical protein
MKTKLFTLFFSLAGFLLTAQTPACGDDAIKSLQKKNRKDYDKAVQMMNEQIKEYVDQHSGSNAGRPATTTSYTIPVVFHIVHTTGQAYGTGNNISYQQILSQLNALNAAFSKNYPSYNNQTHPSYAQNAEIQFCLASIAMPSSVSFYNGPGGVEKGVMRYADNILTDHLMSNAGATALATLTHPTANHFPFDKYLNIWVVTSIADGGAGIVMGYAPRPLMGAYPLDGVVMRSDIIGDNSTGNNFPLGYGLTQGKILAHEVGHYLNLMHIFEGGCAGANAAGSATDPCDLNGDMICDIEPSTTQNINCNAPIPNTCSASYATGTTTNDMIEDYMSYADDDCMNTFTQGQKLRMHATLNGFRSTLWQISNLAATGVIGPSGCSNAILYIDIARPSTNYCTNASLALSNPTIGNSSTSWLWTLTGGTPASATTTSVSVTYTAPGLYYARLKISDGTVSLTDSIPIAITSCTLDPKKLNRSNWLFGDSCSISFATGNPTINNLVLQKKTQRAFEIAVSMSDSLGNLLFYSDGVNLWDNAHNQVNNSPIFGWNISTANWDYKGSSVYGFTAFEMPKQPGKYVLICIPPNETNVGGQNIYCMISSIIYDSNTHSITPFQSYTHPSIYTSGVGTNRFSEDLCIVPHCNGVDYWVVARGWTSSYQNGNIYAFLFNQNGLNPTAAPVISGPFVAPTGVGGIKPNPAGDKLVCGSGIGKFLLYNFNPATGVASNEVQLPASVSVNQACLTCIFSPNGQYIYLKYGTSSTTGFIQQVSVSSLSIIRTLSTTNPNAMPQAFGYMEIGPDNNIYYNTGNYSYLGKIANPNSPTLSAIAAPVAFAPTYTMCNTNLSLINYMEADKPAEVAPLIAQSSSCSSYSFSVNPCWSIYSATWNFGDGSPTASGNTVTHNYTPGVYTVSLTLSYDGQSIPVYTKIVTISSSTVAISGPAAICKGNTYVNNYSTGNIAGATYTWSASNATISGPNTIPSINLVSGSTGVATLSLQIMNGGCLSTATKTITIDTIPQVALTAATITCVGNTVPLNGTPPGGAYTGTNVVAAALTPTVTGAHKVYYTYTNANGCANTASLSVMVNACTGLEDLNGAIVFKLYPNPSNGIIYMNGNTKVSKIDVFNTIGQIVLEKDQIHSETATLDLSQAAKGIYVVRIFTEKGVYTQRVMKD